MSYEGNMRELLPSMLKKYPVKCHAAIVETFFECMGEGFSDETISDLIKLGRGFSLEADAELDEQMNCWGIE